MVKRWLGWDQLNTKTLGAGSDTPAITAQSKDVHIQESNREILQDITLVNNAAFRGGGGYIPGTGTVKSLTVTDNTQTVFFQPGAGEVYQIFSGYAVVSSPGGSVQHNLYFVDQTNSNEILWFYYSSSSSSLTFGSDADWKPSYYFDENMALEYKAVGSYTDSTLYLSMMRVR